MNLIKLDAIDSTNDFLKKLSQNESIENLTVVTAKSQTNGRGQMGAKWNSEARKNLITSILIKDLLLDINAIFDLNVAVALAVIKALEHLEIPDLAIKWPNDIVAENKKIGGILIENSIKSNGTIESVVGIGLNVNQTNFENLPKASSLKCISKKYFEVDDVLIKIFNEIKLNLLPIKNQELGHLWKRYNDKIFKKGTPMPFEDLDKKRFMGIIQKVKSNGQLEILLEDDSLKCFQIKEIQMLY